MKKVFAYWLFFGMFFCMQGTAQDITPIACPLSRTLTSTGKLISFKTLCDNVEFVDDGILIPTACPFTVKIQGFEKTFWMSYPCPMFFQYFKEEQGT